MPTPTSPQHETREQPTPITKYGAITRIPTGDRYRHISSGHSTIRSGLWSGTCGQGRIYRIVQGGAQRFGNPIWCACSAGWTSARGLPERERCLIRHEMDVSDRAMGCLTGAIDVESKRAIRARTARIHLEMLL